MIKKFINLIIGKNYLFASNKEIEKAFFTWNRDYKLNPSKYSMEGSAEELTEKQTNFFLKIIKNGIN